MKAPPATALWLDGDGILPLPVCSGASPRWRRENLRGELAAANLRVDEYSGSRSFISNMQLGCGALALPVGFWVVSLRLGQYRVLIGLDLASKLVVNASQEVQTVEYALHRAIPARVSWVPFGHR